MPSHNVQHFDPANLTTEQAAVCEPIQQYFLGHARDDASFMRQAFLPTAHIESMRDGVFTSWPLELYCERFKGAPATDEASRRRSIDWVDVRGSAACAKVTLVHGATTFTDYFVLLNTAQGWKIANKAFQGQPT
ncbi:nuclear transport factor 2 family protein [Azohydromonas caseinilytica]|uniref:Nuclear transport factor 2 family protein n=1 Tax=Azohydromonas caseinilytica TaxID=2728836 RepID=A0A848FDV6_9BURK|nr:nuclear transport factor 2 family protein [Azohydromonas caseinilytica]NML16463.1 nuclear transport factor 2 family protein [Azohydromonas caseinilytica]